MKPIIRFAVVGAVAAILAAAPLALGDDAKRDAARLAVKLIIKDLGEKSASVKIDEKPLLDEINGNKGRHSSRKESEEIIRTLAYGQIAGWYSVKINDAIRKYEKSKPEDEVWFTPDEKKSMEKIPESAANASLNPRFGGIFERVRGKACDDQKARVTANIHPSESEVETMDEVKLRSYLTDRIVRDQNQREPVFEENVPFVGSNLVDPIISDARTQLVAQKGLVANSDGGQSILPSDVGSFIRSAIDQYRSELSKNKEREKPVARWVYGVFPSVASSIPARSEAVAAYKFSKFVSEFNLECSKADLKGMMNSSMASHKNRNESWNNCFKALGPAILGKAVAAYASKLPSEKQQAAAEFARRAASSCKPEVDALVTRTIGKPFHEARQEIAGEQFGRFFGPLVKGAWRPSEKEISSHYSGMAVVIDKPLSTSGIASSQFDESILLDETVAMVSDSQKKIVEEGLSAMRLQMQLSESVCNAAAIAIKSEPTPPSDDVLTENLVRVLSGKWSSSNAELSVKYGIFSCVKDDVRRRVKDMLPLEAQRRSNEAKAKAERKAAADAEAKRKADEESRPKPVPQEKSISDRITKGFGQNMSQEQDRGSPGNSGGKGGGQKGSGGGTDGGKGGGSGPGGGGKGDGEMERPGGELIVDLVIDFDKQSDGNALVTLRFVGIHSKAAEKEYKFMIDPSESDDPEELADKLSNITQMFQGWLGLVINGAGQNENQEVLVVARVFSGGVSYNAVNAVRRCLARAANSVKSDKMKVYWFDDFFKDKDRNVMPRRDEIKSRMPMNMA
jgi:uncharacterized membrane protein YgcG